MCARNAVFKQFNKETNKTKLECPKISQYRSKAAITFELKWLKGFLLSLGMHHPQAIKLFCHSYSALCIAKNHVFERAKHIEVDFHFVHDAITNGLIAPSYIPITDHLADVFTKALGKL